MLQHQQARAWTSSPFNHVPDPNPFQSPRDSRAFSNLRCHSPQALPPLSHVPPSPPPSAMLVLREPPITLKGLIGRSHPHSYLGPATQGHLSGARSPASLQDPKPSSGPNNPLSQAVCLISHPGVQIPRLGAQTPYPRFKNPLGVGVFKRPL